MKKKFIILLLVVALLPLRVFAKSFIDDYNTMNFVETLKAEGMEIENPDYQETDKQAIIYLFRGQGCTYCRAFLTFLNSISKEYGQYFKVISFEVWNDANNSTLLNKVPLVTNEPAGGVPYIVIGEKVFGGYASQYDEDIKAAIMAQYNDPSYDVMEKLDERLNGNGQSNGATSIATIFWNAAVVLVGAGVVIYFNNKNTQKVLDAMNKKETKETKKK